MTSHIPRIPLGVYNCPWIPVFHLIWYHPSHQMPLTVKPRSFCDDERSSWIWNYVAILNKRSWKMYQIWIWINTKYTLTKYIHQHTTYASYKCNLLWIVVRQLCLDPSQNFHSLLIRYVKTWKWEKRFISGYLVVEALTHHKIKTRMILCLACYFKHRFQYGRINTTYSIVRTKT